MALTRKFLVAMGIEAEKIDEIINSHAETVEALKAERDEAKRNADTYKADADKLAGVQKELDALKAEMADGNNPFEAKYNDTKAELDALKKEYDEYKAGVDAKEQAVAKERAYGALLEEAGISKKRIDSVMRVTDLNSIQLDKDGALKDKDNLLKSVKEEWSDFIVTESQQGADTPNPQTNSGGEQAKGQSRAARIAAQYHSNLYGETKEA